MELGSGYSVMLLKVVSYCLLLAVSTATISFLYIAESHAGAAACVIVQRIPGKSTTDLTYKLRIGPVGTGYNANKLARKDVKEISKKSPHCVHSRKAVHGVIVIIRNYHKSSKGDMVTSYGIGIANSAVEAEAAALKRLKNRYWNWTKQSGYKVVEIEKF